MTQYLNLASAHQIINNFLKKNNLSFEQRQFLNKINDEIVELQGEIQILFNLENYLEKNLTKEVGQKVKEAHLLVQSYSRLLVSLLEEKIRECKKSNDSDSYSALLHQLKNNLEAALDWTVENFPIEETRKPLVNRTLLKASNLHNYCKRLGGNFFPFSQGFDPFFGYSIGRNGKREGNGGECHGLTENWIMQVQKEGYTRQIPLINKDVQNIQQEQQDYSFSIFKKSYDLSSEGMKKLLEHVSINHIYRIDISGSIPGHSVGIRRFVDSDNQQERYELFDPNFGLFVFKDQKSAQSFLAMMMLDYRLYGLEQASLGISHRLTPENQCSSLEIPDEKKRLNKAEVFNYIEQFESLYRQSQIEKNKEFTIEEYEEGYGRRRVISRKEIKNAFLVLLESLVEDINDISGLKRLKKEIISKEDLFINKFRNRCSLFENAFWRKEKTDTYTEAVRIIDEKIKKIEEEKIRKSELI